MSSRAANVGGIKAVLFDMDGVLIDSEPVWDRVRGGFVEQRGGRWTADVQRQMMGVSTVVWSTRLTKLLGGSPTPEEVATLVTREMADAYRQELPLIDGAAASVRNMAGRFRLGLASGSPRALIDLVLDLSEMSKHFTAVLSTDEVARGKPAPDPYLELCRRLRVAPSECVTIEDSSNGLRSAGAAGTRVIALPRPGYPPDTEALALSEIVLQSVSELTHELVLNLDRRG